MELKHKTIWLHNMGLKHKHLTAQCGIEAQKTIGFTIWVWSKRHLAAQYGIEARTKGLPNIRLERKTIGCTIWDWITKRVAAEYGIEAQNVWLHNMDWSTNIWLQNIGLKLAYDQGQVRINYSLPESMPVTVRVFDVLGRPVKALFEGYQTLGNHQHIFESRQARLSAGIYVVSVQAGRQVFSQKMKAGF